jgi:hypothetical protein
MAITNLPVYCDELRRLGKKVTGNKYCVNSAHRWLGTYAHSAQHKAGVHVIIDFGAFSSFGPTDLGEQGIQNWFGHHRLGMIAIAFMYISPHDSGSLERAQGKAEARSPKEKQHFYKCFWAIGAAFWSGCTSSTSSPEAECIPMHHGFASDVALHCPGIFAELI